MSGFSIAHPLAYFKIKQLNKFQVNLLGGKVTA